jgi:hypothetical protein
VNMPSGERRRDGAGHALFRTIVAEVLSLLEALPERPTQADLQPIRERLLGARSRLKGDRELDHKMRNILTITGLSAEAASPAETVEWIKQVVRD